MSKTEEETRILEIVKKGLSRIGKTANGLGYSFVNLDIESNEIQDLYDLLKSYPHLRYINISKNNIKNL
jgi:Leucine-rich repeat (LRR) protein